MLTKFKNYDDYKDIIITIPAKIKWEDYEEELKKVENGQEILNFKVSNFPNKTTSGKKCYLLHDGKIKGYMFITGMKEQEFFCSTTGKKWKGKFIQRSGKFYKLENPIEMKGFRGFKYVDFDI